MRNYSYQKFIVLFFITLILISGSTKVFSQNEPLGMEDVQEVMVKGKVIKVLAEEKVMDPVSRKPTREQLLKIRLRTGPFKGKEIAVKHMETDNPVFNIKVAPGDSVSIELTVRNGKITDAYIADLIRETQVYIMAVLFIILLLAIGRRKGAKALCALLLTLVLIWGVLLPGILRGYNPVILTITVAVIATAITLLVVGGFTIKSLTAILGTFGGVAIAGCLALMAGKAAHLTGFGTEEAAMLLYIPQNIKLDIQGLLFAGIIIGALGASMDVSMSIAAAVEEIKRVCPELKTGQLIQSGMNVGRDIMGTMTNTLILAYTGSSLPLILIFMAYQISFMKIINLDMVASEAIRALSGSIGMIMVIPLTAVIAGLLFGKKSGTSRPEGKKEINETEKDYNFLEDWPIR